MRLLVRLERMIINNHFFNQIMKCFVLCAVVCIPISTISLQRAYSEWEVEYVLSVGHLHRYTMGKVDRDDRTHGGISLPRSSFYSHQFLRAQISYHRINHRYENPAFDGYVFYYHDQGLPFLVQDVERINEFNGIGSGGGSEGGEITTPIEDPGTDNPIKLPETKVIDWELY